MISTDNHLGYCELDPVRKEDSFASFREMLQLAQANQVDFVLLGGDLFHDNKPSRATLCKTVNILRQFAFGENPITFEIISDQAKNFPTTSDTQTHTRTQAVVAWGRQPDHAPWQSAPLARKMFLICCASAAGLQFFAICSKTVNYEDPNFNVALPIFSIHGNHDDPSGAGAYSTMDLLHSCSLLNYFGKIERVDQIVNYPILITKGDSKLALYGMGNVRDERLHRTFEMDGVKWSGSTSSAVFGCAPLASTICFSVAESLALTFFLCNLSAVSTVCVQGQAAAGSSWLVQPRCRASESVSDRGGELLKRCRFSLMSDRSPFFLCARLGSASPTQHSPHADAARLSAREILAVMARHGHLGPRARVLPRSRRIRRGPVLRAAARFVGGDESERRRGRREEGRHHGDHGRPVPNRAHHTHHYSSIRHGRRQTR